MLILSVIFTLALTILTSCGKKVINKVDGHFYGKQMSFMLTEGQCSEQTFNPSILAKEIENLYLKQKLKSPQDFLNISSRLYSENDPLVLSLEKIKETYDYLKEDAYIGKKNQDLFNLYNESRRYEDQKCSFLQLAEKKKNDVRPFLNFTRLCQEKYQADICPDEEYMGMTVENEKWVKTNVLELCKSFSVNVNCEFEYSLHFMKNSLGKMVKKYYERFQKERYFALFRQWSNHLKFKCSNDNDKITMLIKVQGSAFKRDFLEDLLGYVEKVWANKDFLIKFELVENDFSDVIKILPTSKGISYVPENNNQLIYLSTGQDTQVMKRVLAHEFGHVLGFPDCYVEFFDYTNKELVYYEISKEARNIMCSLRDDVQVQESYFTQLAENSCVFN